MSTCKTSYRTNTRHFQGDSCNLAYVGRCKNEQIAFLFDRLCDLVDRSSADAECQWFDPLGASYQNIYVRRWYMHEPPLDTHTLDTSENTRHLTPLFLNITRSTCMASRFRPLVHYITSITSCRKILFLNDTFIDRLYASAS